MNDDNNKMTFNERKDAESKPKKKESPKYVCPYCWGSFPTHEKLMEHIYLIDY